MEPGDSNSSSVTIRCKGRDAIARAVAATHGFCAAAMLEDGTAARLAIVVEELVTNLVEHGGVEEDGEVELSLDGGDGAIRIGLSDNGRAFDPREAAATDLIPDRGGGAGLDLVRAWAEIVDYRSREGWNRLDLRMPAQPSGGASGPM